jgi:hypothetical protein
MIIAIKLRSTNQKYSFILEKKKVDPKSYEVIKLYKKM